MKGIDNILKPLYDLWHKVMDKLSVVNNRIVVDGQEIVVKFVVENVKTLTDEQCESLQCGDVIAKKTGNQFHCYKVTYKEDKQGLVITYMDASVIEGQSYDYVEGHWVYNSEDKTIPGGHTDAEVKALAVDAVEEATSGTVAEVIGLDSNGDMVKGAAPSAGKKFYKHSFYFTYGGGTRRYIMIDLNSTPITSGQNIADRYNNCIKLLFDVDSTYHTYGHIITILLSSSSGGVNYYNGIYARKISNYELASQDFASTTTVVDSVTEL